MQAATRRMQQKNPLESLKIQRSKQIIKRMNNWMWMVAFATMVMANGCTKDKGCKPVPPESEFAAIEAFINAQGINATRHPSGLYYEIIIPGSLNKPIVSSRVFVRYIGKTFDGNIFDQQSNPGNTGWPLSTLIEGWKIGIPLIGKGGKIKLIIPSALAYGCQGSGESIPADTPLYFEIELFDFI